MITLYRVYAVDHFDQELRNKLADGGASMCELCRDAILHLFGRARCGYHNDIRAELCPRCERSADEIASLAIPQEVKDTIKGGS